MAVVPSCGFDSVPSDFGIAYVQTEHLYNIQCVARNMYTEK